MEEVKVRELPDKPVINTTDYVVVEDEDGTKIVQVKHFRSLVLNTLYFDSVEELKTSTEMGLKEGDVCQTLGYYEPGDGGASRYVITYKPGVVEDGRLVHYLSYSDTLRAEIILDDKINVAQFGAKGDGKTDDTLAIQAAIDNSKGRVVEFVKDNEYVISKPININKDNTIINGNGAVLTLQNVDGITISDNVFNVTINDLNIDCQLATRAMYLFKANKVNMNNLTIKNVTNTGIYLKNSLFVNIDNCDIYGTGTANSLIVLDGEDDTDYKMEAARFINIKNCRFNDFYKAINIMGTGIIDIDSSYHNSINSDNCYYSSNINGACCIYGSSEVTVMNINSAFIDRVNKFLYLGGSSVGTVNCKDIHCTFCNSAFDIGSTDIILCLTGYFEGYGVKTIFENMAGNLRLNLSWYCNIGCYPEFNFNNLPIGELFDSIMPYQYKLNTGSYNVSNSLLRLHEVRNIHVDWNSPGNLSEIENGIKGQLLYITSSTNKSIINVANKIILSDSSIQLNPYKGILLKFDGLKWIQIN